MVQIAIFRNITGSLQNVVRVYVEDHGSSLLTAWSDVANTGKYALEGLRHVGYLWALYVKAAKVAGTTNDTLLHQREGEKLVARVFSWFSVGK